MANPSVLTKSLAAASVNNICLSQSALGAQNLTLNGAAVSAGVATLDTARRVLITSVGDDSAIGFTITGTNEFGNPIQERVTGGSGSGVATLQDYLTVTTIATSAATAGAVTVGTNTTGSTAWKMIDPHVTPTSVALGGQVNSGSASWGVEYTYNPPQGVPPNTGNQPWTYPAAPTPIAHPVLQSITGSAEGAITMPARAWRMTISSGTGVVQLTGNQAGIA